MGSIGQRGTFATLVGDAAHGMLLFLGGARARPSRTRSRSRTVTRMSGMPRAPTRCDADRARPRRSGDHGSWRGLPAALGPGARSATRSHATAEHGCGTDRTTAQSRWTNRMPSPSDEPSPHEVAIAGLTSVVVMP